MPIYPLDHVHRNEGQGGNSLTAAQGSDRPGYKVWPGTWCQRQDRAGVGLEIVFVEIVKAYFETIKPYVGVSSKFL